MKILDALKALRDRGWLYSREHPSLSRGFEKAARGGRERGRQLDELRARGKMVLASNAELRRWCEKGSVLVDDSALSASDEVPEGANCLVLFPKGQTVTMPFPWGLC